MDSDGNENGVTHCTEDPTSSACPLVFRRGNSSLLSPIQVVCLVAFAASYFVGSGQCVVVDESFVGEHFVFGAIFFFGQVAELVYLHQVRR